MRVEIKTRGVCSGVTPLWASGALRPLCLMSACKVDTMAFVRSQMDRRERHARWRPPEHFPILKRSVTMWNAWREHNKDVRPDLSGATLREADLRGADLTDTTLSRTTLREADISRPSTGCCGGFVASFHSRPFEV
jgi:hypothetical protein